MPIDIYPLFLLLLSFHQQQFGLNLYKLEPPTKIISKNFQISYCISPRSINREYDCKSIAFIFFNKKPFFTKLNISLSNLGPIDKIFCFQT